MVSKKIIKSAVQEEQSDEVKNYLLDGISTNSNSFDATLEEPISGEEYTIDANHIDVKEEPIIVPTVEDEEKKMDVALNVNKELSKPIPERVVKIRPNQTFSTSIGGVFYHFEMDKCANVPENVKNILFKRNMLKPL